jgi:hypothetical protein
MSTELVNSQIDKFLKSKTPEVLCIRGKWGVGKTYTWMKCLKEAQTSGQVALTCHSYVSLFGVNSLEELKFSIFENAITLKDGKLKADLNTLDAFVSSKIGPWRKFIHFAQSIPVVKSFAGGDSLALLSFMMIRDQIVCIDDLERRGQKLDVGDVLGLISFLREQRGCKVILILNDEELKLTDEQKARFEGYLEKVIDVSLVYEPTSQESVDIALEGDDPVSRRIAERCTVLGISNIRVIKNIERYIQLIRPLLTDFDEEVFRQVSSSIALFVWSHYQPGEAPTLEFLTTKKAKSVFGLQMEERLPENEAAWNALLDAYGYTWTDEFDVELIEGVKNGYFDPAKIKKHAKESHEKILATKADGSFEDAWRSYHDSFADNQDEVLDTIYKSFMQNFKYITPLNLNGTVSLFKELGRNDQATEMIRHYVENRVEDRTFFDLETFPFNEYITDPEIKEAFKAKHADLEDKRDIPALLLMLKDNWNDEMLSALSTLPVEDYHRAFKETAGEDLRKMLAGTLQFDRIGNASSEMKEISKRAKEALKLIGAECPINARRVSRFGIVVEEEPAPAARSDAS